MLCPSLNDCEDKMLNMCGLLLFLSPKLMASLILPVRIKEKKEIFSYSSSWPWLLESQFNARLQTLLPLVYFCRGMRKKNNKKTTLQTPRTSQEPILGLKYVFLLHSILIFTHFSNFIRVFQSIIFLAGCSTLLDNPTILPTSMSKLKLVHP